MSGDKGSPEARWQWIAQLAAWLLGLFSSFLLPPPMGFDGDAVASFAQFALTVLVGLFIFLVRRFREPKHAPCWWIAASLALLLSVASFLRYQYLREVWTCDYFGERLIVGSSQDLTPQGASYFQQNPGVSCDQALQDFIGRVEDAWTTNAIAARRMWLAVVYLAILPLLMVSVLGTLQALRCGRSRPPDD